MSNRSLPHVSCSETPGKMLPAQLAARCQHTKPDASHGPFCFELFRRAIVERCSLCWHYLHNNYYSLVRHWIYRRTSPDASTVDDLVQNAFFAFWRSYTPSKLNRAKGLAAVLNYLKSCAATAVLDDVRRAERRPIDTEWDERTVDAYASHQSAEASALQRTTAQSLWNIVKTVCNDECEHVIARLIFLTGLKPRQIAERYPDLFPTVSDVYRVKRNLSDRLRRNPNLQAMCGEPYTKTAETSV